MPCIRFAGALLCLTASLILHGQTPQEAVTTRPDSSAVPRLIQYSGLLRDRLGKPLTGVQGVTFAFYQDQGDNTPLWLETQNVTADADGRFIVLLGATQPGGLSLDLFTSGQVHWLGVRADALEEQPRTLLASVPYALVATRTEAAPVATGAAAESRADSTHPIRAAAPPNNAERAPAFEATNSTGPGVFINATSGPPLLVSSQTKVANLNVDLLNGFHDTDFAKIAGGNTFSGTQAGKFTGDGSGLTSLNASNVATGTLAPARGGTGLSVCADGQVLKWSGGLTGLWTCGTDNSNLGTVTNIATGNGLTGGPVTSAGTVSMMTCPNTQVLTSVNGTWNCGFPNVGTITSVVPGSGLTGGGSTGGVTLTIDPSVIPKLGLANTFTAPQKVTAGSGPGPIAVAESAATLKNGAIRAVSPAPSAAALSGIQTDTTGTTYGVFGQDNSPGGFGGGFQNNNANGSSLSAFDSTDAEAFTVRGNGNVGIGANSGLARLTVRGKASFTATGTVSVTAGSATVTGSGTKFLTEVAVGDVIVIPGEGSIPAVSIQSDLSLTVATAFSTPATGAMATVIPSMFRADDASGMTRLVVEGDGVAQIGLAGTAGQRLVVNGVESTMDGVDGSIILRNDAPGGASPSGTGPWFLRAGATGTNTPAGGFSISQGRAIYRLVIDGTGQVGIGTTTPGKKLDVQGGQINASGGLCMNGDCRTGWSAVGGTVTQVNTGIGLTGGPITTTGTVSLNTSYTDGRYAQLGVTNTFTTAQIIGGDLSVTGGDLNLPDTANASTGVVKFGGVAFLHGYPNHSNTFLGASAGNFSTAGVGLTAVGNGALSSNTAGNSNTAVGNGALFSNTTGNGNTATGFGALNANAGNRNTAMGAAALLFNVSGAGNTAMGQAALRGSIFGNLNTAVGQLALTANNGQNNTAVGQNALASDVSGIGNTALGWQAGVTANPANANNGGSYNTFIGANSGPGTVGGGLSNATAIGANALVSAPNSLVLGDGTVNVGIGTSTPLDTLHVVGNIRVSGCLWDGTTVFAGACASDERFKQNVKAFAPSLENVARLRPVEFEWRTEQFPERRFGSGRSYGLIAQEVEKVLPGLVTQDEQGFKAVKYSALPLLTLGALQELKAQKDELADLVKAQQAQIKLLQEAVGALQERLGVEVGRGKQ